MMIPERSTLDMNRQVMDTWFAYDDFKEGGLDYVAFILKQDATDIEQRVDERDAIEELADVCINARRMMLERGYDPDEEILNRLFQHSLKGQEDIIEKYQSLYEQNE